MNPEENKMNTETEGTAPAANEDAAKDTAETIEAEAVSPKKKKIAYDESLFENSTVFAAPTSTKRKKIRLTPAKRGIIISAAALVIACAVLAVTLLMPQPEDTSDSSSLLASAPTYTVLSVNEDSVTAVTVYNAAEPEGFTLIKNFSDTSSSGASSSDSDSSADKGYTWGVQGYEQYSFSGAQYLVNAAISMSATKEYSADMDVALADDYSIGDFSFGSSAADSDSSSDDGAGNRYGFDTPYCVINATGDTSYTIVVGDASPDDSGRYVTVSGDESIYIVSEKSMTYFSDSYLDMLDMAVTGFISQNDSNADYFTDGALSKIDSLTLGGTCRDKKVVIESPPEALSTLSFLVTAPVYRAGNEETIGEIVGVASTGVYSGGAFVIGYTESDLAKYGLDKPLSTCDMKIADFSMSLKFGTLTDGYYPCITTGSDIIYKIAPESYGWIEYQDTDLYFESLFLEYIADISSIRVQTDDIDATFNLVRETEGSGTDFTVECAQAADGVTIESKQLSYYYGRILNLATEEFTNDAIPAEEPYISFTITYINSSHATDVIELRKFSSRRYYYTLNGNGNSLVKSEAITDLHDRLPELLAGNNIGRKS